MGFGYELAFLEFIYVLPRGLVYKESTYYKRQVINLFFNYSLVTMLIIAVLISLIPSDIEFSNAMDDFNTKLLWVMVVYNVVILISTVIRLILVNDKLYKKISIQYILLIIILSTIVVTVLSEPIFKKFY